MDTMDATDRARSYGVRVDDVYTVEEVKELRESVNHSVTVWLGNPNLAKVLRLRLIGYCRDTPWWDVSYCYGELKDGTHCRVQIPLRQISRNWRADFIAWGKENRVFIKGLGILGDDVCSRVYG